MKTPEEKIANSNIPNEFKKVSMPDYVVEPPDLIVVEVLDALPGRPISGERLVRPDGKISLSFYGDVYVAGLTLPEVKEKIILHLRKFLHDDVLGLIKIDDATGEPMRDSQTDEFVRIEPRDSDRVFVDITAYNSKNYYVLGDVLVTGKMPITGNETVLDAINYAGGLTPTAAPQNIRLVRPAPPGACWRRLQSTSQVSPAAVTPPPTTRSCPAIESSSIETRSSGSRSSSIASQRLSRPSSARCCRRHSRSGLSNSRVRRSVRVVVLLVLLVLVALPSQTSRSSPVPGNLLTSTIQPPIPVTRSVLSLSFGRSLAKFMRETGRRSLFRRAPPVDKCTHSARSDR